MSHDSSGSTTWNWKCVPDGPGILAIRRRSTGRSYYIGVADLRQRASDHHRLLTRGIHHNLELQTDWRADAGDFEFTVVEVIHCVDLLNLFKQVWVERTPLTYNKKNAVRRRA